MFPSSRPGNSAPGFQPFIRVSLLTASMIGLLATAGCASASPSRGFKPVEETVTAHGGPRVIWRSDTPQDHEAAAAVDDLLKQPLTADGAVQVALLNNSTLQATYEEIGIAQADLVQAGLLSNPVFGVSARRRSPGPTATAWGFSLVQNFLELLNRPLHKKIAAAELERTRLRVSHEVFSLAGMVRRDYYTLQANQQLLGRLDEIVKGNEAAAEIATRQRNAGTLGELGQSVQQSALDQMRLLAIQLRLQCQRDREALSRDMGLTGDALTWQLTAELAEPPENDPPLAGMEARAVAQRLDLAAARAETEAYYQNLRRTRGFRFVNRVELGFQTEKPLEAEPGAPRLSGPEISLELPLFDRGQGKVPLALALLRQSQARTREREVSVRSEVREAHARLQASREMIRLYTTDLLPLRRRIVTLTFQQYNAMLKGVYDLLLAKQAELEAERGSIEALRDYWISRSELERAVGGSLPGDLPATPAATPPPDDSHATPQPIPSPAVTP